MPIVKNTCVITFLAFALLGTTLLVSATCANAGSITGGGIAGVSGLETGSIR